MMETKKVYRTEKLWREEVRVDEYIPVIDLKEHIRQVTDRWKTDGKPEFQPSVSHNRDGKFVEALWSPNSHYAEDVRTPDGEYIMTLLKDRDTHEVVGVQIWGIHKVLGLTEVKE